MAAATSKSTRLTDRIAGKQHPARLAKGRLISALDTEAILTTEVDDVGDVVLFDLFVPSNGIHQGVWFYNDDLDAHATPTLVTDVGLYAPPEGCVTITSGTKTVNAAYAVLDADILVDGVTTLQAATTDWTRLTPDSATFGPEDANKAYWEILGYDEDPKCNFLVGITHTAAAATAQAGDLSIRIDYYVD